MAHGALGYGENETAARRSRSRHGPQRCPRQALCSDERTGRQVCRACPGTRQEHRPEARLDETTSVGGGERGSARGVFREKTEQLSCLGGTRETAHRGQTMGGGKGAVEDAD